MFTLPKLLVATFFGLLVAPVPPPPPPLDPPPSARPITHFSRAQVVAADAGVAVGSDVKKFASPRCAQPPRSPGRETGWLRDMNSTLGASTVGRGDFSAVRV